MTPRPQALRAVAWTALLALAWLPVPAAGQNAPSFQGIGDLSGGEFSSAALAVSTDASTVVGSSGVTDGTEAVLWTEGGGLVGLGQPGGVADPFGEATGVSGDGSVVAGTVVNSSGGRAFRWTPGGGYDYLDTYGCFGCDPATTGEGISADGDTVVGSGLNVPFLGSPRVHASRWDSGGNIHDLGDLPGGGDAAGGVDASADGSLIVGDGDSSLGSSGFYWTSGAGMQQLMGIPGAIFRTSALAVSDDGSTIVGEANTSASSSNQLQPMRWPAPFSGTPQNLGALPGQASARGRAFDVTPDGGIIVGTTRNLQGEDVAFLWTAADGMRDLALVLEEEYGLDLGSWQLHEARGVSDVNGAGEFTIVGTATNPSGDPEGFVAVLSPTACNDGDDNDSDNDVDFPDDDGCTSLGDRSELDDCADGLDNDGDGQVDGADPDCTSASDRSELPDCGNGFDDDGDGFADHPDDPGCRSPASQTEEPECDDGADNDGDLAVDGADPECLDPSDTSERDDCADGFDNDGDGQVDGADPDCIAPDDPSEDPACSDFVDNDGDGRVDHPAAYPRCTDAQDATEAPECDDGADNDGDLDADFPADAQCGGPLFDVEAPSAVAAGDLLVVDRAQATLYAIDPGSGAETILSQDAVLLEPEGLAVRGDGRVVVATPSGLLEIEPQTGRQELRSGPFTSVGGVPVVADSSGDLVVLDQAGIHRVTWNPAGVGATTTLLAVPVGTDLSIFTGFTLELEDDDTALTTGFGLLGDGVFRADLVAGTVSKVTPGFLTHSWRDLVLESPGTLLAAGWHSSLGEGVFRIDTSSGAVTALSTDPAWVRPDGVAVDGSGDIYVVDSGTCAGGACTGGLVAHVDPVTGARSVVRAGLFAGPLEIAVAGAPPAACDDGLDNDGDGFTDTADPGCASGADTDEQDAALPCDNGVDDDTDGLRDFPADPGCRDPAWFFEDPQCDDDVDNDGDGKIDWDGGAGAGTPDPQCTVSPFKNREKGGCGLGFEIVLVAPLLGRILRRRRRPDR